MALDIRYVLSAGLAIYINMLSLQISDEIIFKASDAKVWKIWCSDLIDWSQSAALASSKVNLHVSTGLSGVELRRFVQVLEAPYIGRGKHYDKKVSLPPFTREARDEFRRLLNELRYPIIQSPTDLSEQMPVEDPTFLSTSTWKWEVKDITVRKKLVRSTQIKALTIARHLEVFARKHWHDRYLVGYARLYAGLIRLHWEDKLDTAIADLTQLQSDYSDMPIVSMMAQWYKILSLAHLGRIFEVNRDLRNLQQRFRDSDYAVIHLAHLVYLHPAKMKEILNGFLFSPPRQEEPLIK